MQLPEVVHAGYFDSQKVVADGTKMSKKRAVNMFEIELPTEKGGFSHINDNSMQYNTNMLVCAKPGQMRNSHLPIKCYYVHIILNEGKLYDILMNCPDYLIIENYEEYKNIFLRIFDCISSVAPNSDILLNSIVFELIYKISNDNDRRENRTEGNMNETILKALDYIKEHLSEDLSLEALAEYTSFSPVYFHNLFKESVGIRLRSYVETKRIKKACNLLMTTDMTLTEIALECGFSSQSYFSYVFKRRMKETPREYVRRINERYIDK